MLEVKLESQDMAYFFTSSTFRFRFISSVYPIIRRLLIPIGFKIIDIKGLKHLLRVPRADAAVLILVLVITTSLIQAVLGVALHLSYL
jgi:hypothetical protein